MNNKQEAAKQRYKYELDIKAKAMELQSHAGFETWTQLSKAFGRKYGFSENTMREICNKHNWKAEIMSVSTTEKPMFYLTAKPKQGFSQNVWADRK